ncbi:DUF5667 domain-containing protein [Nocardioides xinjiangensis]|uniref:DUF5667 domain-containing protein n=1 Tax=Nocardioides xinjiangensis TaxID=2817376 RepID=UPI001B30EE91|nr:DUF5667 domain-containing protein [Nocardioides sp. SYSU D00778]
MTPPFSARRRADEFEALLARGPGAARTERESAHFADLLEVVADLRALPEAAPRPEFVSSLRERLMIEADTVLVRQPTAPSRLAMPARSRTRDRRVAAVLGGAALVGAAGTMAVAAQDALPGESLYGVKRGIEAAEVRFAPDDAARGRALLAQAETRLSELEALASGDEGRDQLIPDTLDSFTDQSSDGVRDLLASYEATGADRDALAAREFTTASIERLDGLHDRLPESARDELLAAGRTLTDLDLEVSNQCAGCPGGITSVPEFLLSSAPGNLLSGLDADEQTLEAAPLSGQDLSGLRVPELLVPPRALPTQPSTTTLPPTQSTSGTPVAPPPSPTRTDPVKPEPTAPVKNLPQDVTGSVTGTVTDTTSDLASQLNGVTGGALGGLTSGVDNATGGLIGEVTGGVDGLTGGALNNATGGLLPGGRG